MPRFALSLFIGAATAVPVVASGPWPHGPSWINPRSAKGYSTYNTREALTTPGANLLISPEDSFDFTPSLGNSNFLVDDEGKTGSDEVKWAYDWIYEWAKNERAIVVRGGDDEVNQWAAKKKFQSKHEVPRPTESLPGQTLSVKSAEMIISGVEGICHWIEQERHVCHQPHGLLTVIEVTVSSNGKPNTLWVACHDIEHEEAYKELGSCHVMNVGDVVFTAGPKKNLRQAEANPELK